MGNRLEHDDAAHPAMEEVERVERHAQKRDQRVVTAREGEQGDHVDDGEIASAVADEGANLAERPRVVDGDDAKSDIGRKVAQEEGELQACRESAHVEGAAELELAIVTLAEDGSILDVALEPRIGMVWDGEVALCVVVETDHLPHLAHHDDCNAVDEHGRRDDTQHEEQVVRKHLVHHVGIQAAGWTSHSRLGTCTCSPGAAPRRTRRPGLCRRRSRVWCRHGIQRWVGRSPRLAAVPESILF